MKKFRGKSRFLLIILILASIQLYGIVDQKNEKNISNTHITKEGFSNDSILAISSLSWWMTKRLTYNSANLEYPEIAVSDDYVHVVFLDGNTLAYKRSKDGGTTWEARQNLGTFNYSPVDRNNYAIAAKEQYVHVLMQGETKIWYRRNTGYGNSARWGIWRTLTSSDLYSSPDIAVNGQHVHIVYTAGDPEEIYYKRISNYGVGSSITKRLTYSSSISGDSQYPRIATSTLGQYVYIVYQDDWPGKNQIFLKIIPNYGDGSLITKRLTHNFSNSKYPDIAAYGEYIFVVFENVELSGDTNLFSKTIENYGSGNITTRKITYANACNYGTIAFDSTADEVQIAYFNSFPSIDEILWKLIPIFGKGACETYRLTYNTGYSLYPDIAIQGGKTHIVYQDNSPGSFEIFYKRFDPSVIIPCGIPYLISPEEGAVLDNGRTDKQDSIIWDFDWTDVPGANVYHLFVMHTGAEYPVINCLISSSFYHYVSLSSYIADFNRFNWKWKVRPGHMVYGRFNYCGEWSEERSFDVEPVNTDPPS